VARGGQELLDLDDPLEAEGWASAMLGTFWKLDAPFEAQKEIETRLWPEVIKRAETRGTREALAILEALAALGDDPVWGSARAAADRLLARGVERPSWAAALGSVSFEGAWALHDVFGDQEAYFATFRYPGRTPHVVNALYDKAMGGIIKDGFVGYPVEDPRERMAGEDGMFGVDVEAGVMARRVIEAIQVGDMYLDNDWTPEFRRFRALILARMRRLPLAPPLERPDPPSDGQREAMTAEFMASGTVDGHDESDVIVAHCLDYVCDYLGEEPFRWSPIVVEQFLLDYLPRKVSMRLSTVAQLPPVLRAWVRFALSKRGLEARWIAESEEAVDRFAPEFRRAMTDADAFGPAKLIGNAMLADGVDPLDQASVDRWLEDFNSRPIEQRDELLRRLERRSKLT
jgi:hypothetical protein